jgi:hypothetical protein
MSMSGKTNRPSPQNMKARLERGAAASSMVIVNGILCGQKGDCEGAGSRGENDDDHVVLPPLATLCSNYNSSRTNGYIILEVELRTTFV